MEIIVIILIIVLLGAVIFVIQKLNVLQKPSDNQSQRLMLEMVENVRKEVQESGGKNRQELQDRLDKITNQLIAHQNQSTNTLQQHFGQTAKIISEVTQKLTQLDETNKQVKGFAEQMQSLENILKNPKRRGVLSEYWLEAMLSHSLQPGQYQMQYSLGIDDKTGQELIVDAAIFANDKIIPIDAKFSLEKYNMIQEENDPARRTELEKFFKADIKMRIDETSKYIQPLKGTLDFAFMFLPAEGIYYDLLVYKTGSVDVNAQSLMEYAFHKHVLIVSPTSFFAYLQTVLHGLRAMQVQDSIKDVITRIALLGKHLIAYDDFMKKVGNTIGTTVNSYNTAYRELQKVDKDVMKITDKSVGGEIEAIILEKPQIDE